MRIFARSPGLALLSGFAAMMTGTWMVVQEVMAMVRTHRLPCAVQLSSVWRFSVSSPALVCTSTHRTVPVYVFNFATLLGLERTKACVCDRGRGHVVYMVFTIIAVACPLSRDSPNSSSISSSASSNSSVFSRVSPRSPP